MAERRLSLPLSRVEILLLLLLLLLLHFFLSL
jgi:hypothetical protein